MSTQHVQRMSRLMAKTLREDPADAETLSHRLLVRAGLRPAQFGRGVDVAAARQAGPRQRLAHRPRGDGRHRRPGGAPPGPAAQGAVRGQRPLVGVRRPALPAQGPQGRGLPARPDARGDLHPAREGPVHLVQGPAGHAVPDPDQVPRRGAAPVRRAARARVPDEGLVLVRRVRRGTGGVLPAPPRGVRPHLRAARPRPPDRLGGVGCDGRLGVGGVPGSGRGRARTPSWTAPPATTRRTRRP